MQSLHKRPKDRPVFSCVRLCLLTLDTGPFQPQRWQTPLRSPPVPSCSVMILVPPGGLIVIRVISACPGNNCIDVNFPRCIACEGEVGGHRMGPPSMRESLFETMAEESMAPDFHLDEASRWMAESQFVHWCLV
jgi:hypothetical protein